MLRLGDVLLSLLRFIDDVLRFLLVEQWRVTLVAALGMTAVCLLLPRPRRPRPLPAAVAGAAALLLAGLLWVRPGGAAVETVAFYAFSALAVVSGVLLITQANPVRAALSFALVVLSTTGLFLLLAAPFLMAATLIVYAGAIVVTFLFVIMLAQQEGQSNADARSHEFILSALAGFVLLGTLVIVLQPLEAADVSAAPRRLRDGERVETAPGDRGPRLPAENVAALGQILFTDYFLAVELAGTLLLVATVGAIAIAGQRGEGPR